MNKINKETMNIPFSVDTDAVSVKVYERTPQADELFFAELMESTVYPVHLQWDKPGESKGYQHVFGDQYSGSDGNNYLMEKGVTYEFYVMTVTAPATGNFNITFTPAILTELHFDLPANAGEQSSELLTAVTPDVYANTRISLLKSNNFPVSIDIADSTGNTLESMEYTTTEMNYTSNTTLRTGETYQIYARNSSQSGMETSGYFHFDMYFTPMDSVKFSLPADTTPEVIYTRISPSNEFIQSMTLSSATALPVTVNINNGTSTIGHTFTYTGEVWSVGSDFILPLHLSSEFTASNSTTPLTVIDGQFNLVFSPVNAM